MAKQIFTAEQLKQIYGTPQIEQQAQVPEKRSLGEKILGFTGGEKIAQGLGQAIANPEISKQIAETQQQQFAIQGNLLKAIKEKKARGGDVSRLENALSLLNQDIADTGAGAEKLMNQKELTGKQVIGDALQLGATVAGVGTYGKGAAGATSFALQKSAPSVIQGVTNGSGIIKGFVSGAKTSMLAGAGEGAAQGFAQGLKEDKSVLDSAKQGLTTGIVGGVLGGVLGGGIGGISGGITSRRLNRAIIKAQEESGIRTSLSDTVVKKSATNPAFKAVVSGAKKQGYTDSEINFLSTVQDSDKSVMRKMFDVTAKAQSDPRQIVRAADILGENATGIVSQVQSQNTKAGQLVDKTARALRGQQVDVSPLRNGIETKLDDAGIALASDGTLDFSNSVFKNIPKLQKEIQRVLLSVPDGSDAYQVHVFKKSVDELVDYGTGGEGLSGQAASILKSFRNSADDVLDSNFADYNAANTEYKATKEFIDRVRETVGKKVDFSTTQGAQAFGQAFRSAFSNNKSRGQTLALIEELQNIAKTRGLKGAEQNLLDQAIYVNMLEEQFGSQATTGLAGEVSKAINKAKGAVDFVRNPVRGTLNAIGDTIEKAQNITPEAKKQILKDLISNQDLNTATKTATSQTATKNPITRVNSAISTSKPQSKSKSSYLSTAKANLENPKNAQGGFITIGGKTTKAIDSATKKELEGAIDYIRLNKPVTPKMEDIVSKLQEKFGISSNASSAKIADRFEDLIKKTKTKSI